MAKSDPAQDDPGGAVKYECGICLKEFSSSWFLQIHIKTHDEKQSFDCHECGMTFQDFPQLWEHLKQHVYGEETVEEDSEVCDICGKAYPVSQIAMHKRSHIFKPGLTCKTCGKSFGSSQVLKLHLRTHGEKTLYQCQICDLKFASRNSFTLHWNSHQSKDSRKGTKLKSQHLNKASKYKKTGNRYKCNVCSKLFTTTAKMEVHILSHESYDDKKKWAKDTATTAKPDAHVKTDKNQTRKGALMNENPPFFGVVRNLGKNYLCSLCKKEFKGKVKAERHAYYHYYQERQRSCTKSSDGQLEVKVSHGSLHETTKIVVSTKKTKMRKILNRDKGGKFSSRVPGEKSFTCSECDKVFKTVDDLQLHRNTHVRDYALALMRVLSPKKDMDLSLEPEMLLEAVQSAATLTSKRLKKQKAVGSRVESDPEEVSPVVTSETYNGNSVEENDSLELEHFSHNDLNASFVSLPDIFVSPDNSHDKRTEQKLTKRSPEVSRSSRKSSSYSYQEVLKHIMTKKNQMICKICSKVFHTIEKISAHIGRHLKKGEDTSDLLKQFPDLKKMRSVRVVLERLDMHDLEMSSTRKESRMNHSTDVPIATMDKTTNTSFTDYDTCESENTSPRKDMSLVLMCTNEGDSPGYMNDIKNTIVPQCDASDDNDDMDEFEDNYSDSDEQDEEWVPSKSDKGGIMGKTGSFDVEFDTSDSEGNEGSNVHANAVAAAIAVCDLDQDGEQEKKHSISAGQDTDTLKLKKKKELKQHLASLDRLDASNSNSPDQVTSHTSEFKQPVLSAVSDAAAIVSSSASTEGCSDTANSDHLGSRTLEKSEVLQNAVSDMPGTQNNTLGDDDTETQYDEQISSHFSKVGDVYICSICSREFDCWSRIYHHVHNHLREKRFRCKFCGHSFDKMPQLLIHKRIHEKQHAQVGGVTDQDVKNIQDNFYTHDGKFKCKICDDAFKLRNDAYRHVLDHLFKSRNLTSIKDGSAIIPSSELGNQAHEKDKSDTQRAMELIVKENEMFKCLKCEKQIRLLVSAKVHAIKHFMAPPYKCSICPHATYTRHHLDRHMQTHKTKMYPKHRVSYEIVVPTHKVFSADKLTENTENTTKQESKTITNEEAMKFLVEENEKFKCLKCNSSISGCGNAVGHVRRHFVSPQFKCPLCPHATYSRHHLERHFSTHGKEKYPHLVEEHCETFTAKDAMKYVVRVKEKFKCTICGSIVSSERNIKAHVIRHKKHSRFKCPHCDYFHHTRHHLARHILTHERKWKKKDRENKHNQKEDSNTLPSNDPTAETNGSMSLPDSSLTHESSEPLNNEDGSNTADVSDSARPEEPNEDLRTSTARKSSDPVELEPEQEQDRDVAAEAPQRSATSVEFRKKIRENISKCGSNFICAICSKKYATMRKVYAHVKNHLAERRVQCEYCGHTFGNKAVLLQHEMFHVLQLEKGSAIDKEEIKTIKDNFVQQGSNFACLICNSVLKKRTGAYRHVLNHLIFEKKRESGADLDAQNGPSSPTHSSQNQSSSNGDISDSKYKDAAISNSIEDIRFTDTNFHGDTRKEVADKTNMDETNSSDESMVKDSMSECKTEQNSELLGDCTVPDTSNYRLRVRKRSASKSGRDGSDEDQDEDVDLSEDDRDSDYKCDSDMDISEAEDKDDEVQDTDSHDQTHVEKGQRENRQEKAQKLSEGTQSDTVHIDEDKKYSPGKQKDKYILRIQMDKETNAGSSESKGEPTTVDEGKPHYGNPQNSHLQDNIIKIGDKYGCKMCKKKFKMRTSCYHHVSYHFKKKTYVCPDCGYATSSKTYLLVHMNKHKKNMIDFPCKICQRVFSKSSFLTSHVATHSDEDKIKYLNYLKCETCGTVCRTIKVMFRHKLQHLDSFKCKICDDVLPTALAFENHIYEMKHFRCEECGKNYADLKSLTNHQKRIHKKLTPFHCDLCDKKFINSTSLKQHLQAHEQRYPCRECKATFKTLKELKNHKLAKKHDRRYRKVHVPIIEENQCDLCSRHFKTSTRLNCHKLIHQALDAVGADIQDGSFLTDVKVTTILFCPMCKKEYPTLLQLKNHVRIHFEEKRYKCEFCELAFSNRSYFLTHQNIHNNKRPFDCELCQRKFPSLNNLNSHVKKSHSKEKKEKKIVTCDICGKKLVAGSLSAHKILHDEKKHIRNFPCDSCEKKFYSSTQLKSHQRIHSGEANFMCDLCGRLLRSKNNLLEHKKSHTGEKPFKCSVCDRPFKTKVYLRRHFLIHTGEKPHVCDICNKAFSLPETLRNHRNIHTGEKPYKCDLCGERFGDRWAKHNHVKRHTMS